MKWSVGWMTTENICVFKISSLHFPVIKKTWTQKGICILWDQNMHDYASSSSKQQRKNQPNKIWKVVTLHNGTKLVCSI